MADQENSLRETRNARARGAAQAAAERLAIEPTGVVHYNSRGRVLVVGGDEAHWMAARLQPPLHAEVLQTDGDEEPGVPTTVVGGRTVTMSGFLGAFRIELGEKGRHNYQVLDTDLVLDLGTDPLVDTELPPPGYWRFGREPQDLDAAQLAVEGMVGTFEKPRYFHYDPAICAHARSGQDGCRRCIEACPADAIISVGETVEVNPNLCQGGGICATVCPTGAMRYAYPGPADTAERLRLVLRTYLEAGGRDPMILFIAEADALDLAAIPPNVLLIVVEELASIGHELWLAAIAWGARCVLLADGGSVPGKARTALDRQIRFAHDLLAGMGYPRDLLRAIDSRDIALQRPADPETPGGPARFAAVDGKRQLAGLALAHLWERSRAHRDDFSLTPGAPYGRIHVDADRCTLCMSCTSVCPAQALSAGDDSPRLLFYEANCVQCSICANACPERAITLEARYLANPERRRQPVVLYEEPPFCCVVCGKPFATRRVVDNILERLAGHAMFQTERARRRLQMCEDCRVVDALQDDEALQAGLALRGPHNTSKERGS